MKRAITPLSLCAVLFLAGCNSERRPSPTAPSQTAPQPTQPPQPSQPFTSAAYSLTSTLTSVAGVECARRDPNWTSLLGVAEQHALTVERRETTIRLFDNDGSYWGPTMYEGTLTGRDFTASITWATSTFFCPDGPQFPNVTGRSELTGRLSGDESTLTATLRTVWRQSPGDLELLTTSRTWTATRQ
jgi:hypothetical protein